MFRLGSGKNPGVTRVLPASVIRFGFAHNADVVRPNPTSLRRFEHSAGHAHAGDGAQVFLDSRETTVLVAPACSWKSSDQWRPNSGRWFRTQSSGALDCSGFAQHRRRTQQYKRNRRPARSPAFAAPNDASSDGAIHSTHRFDWLGVRGHPCWRDAEDDAGNHRNSQRKEQDWSRGRGIHGDPRV